MPQTSTTQNYQIIHYDSLDSTMDEAKRLIETKSFDKDIVVIVANEQTSGRGTRGRMWASPKDAGLYFSIVHLPSEKFKYEVLSSSRTAETNNNEAIINLTTTYTLSAGVACIEALREYLELPVYIKPVNDIYAKSSKLAGILVEYKSMGINSYLITGVGLNIKDTKYSIKESQISIPKAAPISIEELLSPEEFKSLDKEKLLETLIQKIAFWHNKVLQGDEELVKETWERYCNTK